MRRYECEACETTVTGSPFRRTCPECGAPLSRRSTAGAGVEP